MQYDQTAMELMRQVAHHVADEEAILLPAAESLLGERVDELGARMAKRRLELAVPRAMSRTTLLAAAGAALAGVFLFRSMRHGKQRLQ